MCSNLPSVQRRPRAGLEHGSPGIQLCAGVSQARAGLLVCLLSWGALVSATGTRTRVARVRAEYPNQLDYSGVSVVFFTTMQTCIQHST